VKSIYEHIQDLKTEEWDYYFPNEEILNIQNWSDNDEHKEFIKKYLQRGQKEEVLKHFNFSLQGFKREAHTNSVFFLGCIFYKELNLQINFKREDEHDEFYFIWFLTSLIHDFGYQIENCSNTKSNLSQKITNDISSFKSFYKIDSENDLLNTEYSLEPNTKILLDHVPKYFEARKDGKLGRDDSGKIDHGIAAGLLLFNFLLKNRREREKLNSEKEKNRQETDGLFWGEELEAFYAIASSAIATHNMRRGCEKTDNLNTTLEEYEMGKLIINDIEGNIKKLSFDENSFAFLFALADTLEPLKFYDNCFDIDEILKSIYLKINFNEIIFENKNLELDFKLFTKSVKSLKDWINVDIDIKTKNQIIMKINKSK
jgi:hypothetical protein